MHPRSEWVCQGECHPEHQGEVFLSHIVLEDNMPKGPQEAAAIPHKFGQLPQNLLARETAISLWLQPAEVLHPGNWNRFGKIQDSTEESRKFPEVCPRWLSGWEHRPMHQKVTGSIPSLGQSGRHQIDASLSNPCSSLSRSPFLPVQNQ